LSWARLPKGAVEMTLLLTADQLKRKPAHLWTSEQVYDELKSRRSNDSVSPFTLANDLISGRLDPRSGLVWDGLSEGTSPERHEAELETKIWRERIIRAQAGSHPGGVLRKLTSDIPRSEIRWELVLREFLNTRCLPTTENSWNRPSRRSLSQGQHARFLDAGTERKKGLTRIGVVVDTSGSISDNVLGTFIGEINGIMRVTGAEAVVVDCDAAVHSVRVFRKPLHDYHPSGGGGTDFRPGVAELEKQKATVGVYLTDLCGTFPERPPTFPLLWVATQELTIPFGRRVLIPQK
ncbi:MAG: vWA domain-containing protein, partial [Candidatus Dormibacteria bacterium]